MGEGKRKRTKQARSSNQYIVPASDCTARSASVKSAAEPAQPGRTALPPGVTRSGAGVLPYPGRFIWQLVGVLDTYDGNSFTGASVMPVFSGL